MGSVATANRFAPSTKVKGLKVVERGQDPWSESPYFAPGMTEDSEFMNAWPEGVVIAGIFRGLRKTKNENPKKIRDYGIFETLEGEKFRAQAPGQLRFILENTTEGTYVTMKYLGKELSEKLETDVHAFEVQTAQL